MSFFRRYFSKNLGGDKELSKIKKLLQQGEIDKGSEAIELYLGKEELAVEKRVKCQQLLAKKLLIQSEYEEAFKEAKKVFSQSQKLSLFSFSLESLIIIIEYLRTKSDVTKCVNYLEQGKKILSQMDARKGTILTEGEAILSYLQGLVSIDKGEIDEGLEYYQRSLEYRKKLGDSASIADVLLKIGTAYNVKGNIELSQENFHKSLEIMERIVKIEGKEKLLLCLGNSYNLKSDSKKALFFYKKALAISKELGNKEYIAKSKNNIGVIYLDRSEFDLALDYFFETLELAEQLNHKMLMAAAVCNIGDIYQSKGELELALEYTKRGLLIREKDLKNNEYIAESYRTLGLIYQEKGDPTKALQYLLKSLKINEEVGNQSFIVDSLLYLFLLSLDTENI
ncbi:MAG: tetratricopeptide repeat protein, partial [Candidatus Heimdallarchaeota archaeon]